MDNRGYNSNRRRRKKRITGRFYAFLTIVLVLCVMVGVIVSNRRPAGGGTFTPTALAPTPVPVYNNDTPVVAPAPVDTGSVGTTQNTGGVSTIEELIESDNDLAPLAGNDMVKVTDYSVTQGLSADWRNILLLGSDTRNLKKVSRTDTMIIASINVNDGRIKLTSIMRDTMVPIPGHGTNKLNSASYYGGVDLTVKLINELFGMNITEYVLVNFNSFQKVVDILGGIEVDVTEEEMNYINNGMGEMAQVGGYDQDWYVANKDSLLLKTFGTATHLTGIQALGYARIRKIGSDFQRTERQRNVLNAILQKVRNDANAIQFMQIASSMWGYFETNINMMSAVGLATTVIKNGAKEMKEWRLPAKDAFVSETRANSKGTKVSALYDVNFELCKQNLYKFIYQT